MGGCSDAAALKRVVVPALSGADSKAFLASFDNTGRRPRLAIHTMRPVAGKAAGRALVSAVKATGVNARVSHVCHGADGPRGNSLEDMLANLGCATVVYDPTAIFGRSADLVAFAKALRASAGKAIAGVYWSGEWRTLFIQLAADSFISEDRINLERVHETENAVRTAFRDACGEAGIDYVASLRITFEAPPVGVTAVDQRSAPASSELSRRVAKGVGASFLGASLGLAGVAHAQDNKPAVSAVNGTLSIMGGGFSSTDFTQQTGGLSIFSPGGNTGAALAVGSVSFPVTHQFGVQIDAGGGVTSGDPAVGGSLHVFWREPDTALLGVIGSYAGVNTDEFVTVGGNIVRRTDWRNIGRAGLESEIYLDQFSVLARAGYQFGDAEEDFYGRVHLAYYPIDNFMIAAGPEYMPGVGVAGGFDIEFLEPFDESLGISFFADGAINSQDNFRAFAGIRLYFGADKTLIRRHREDDPRPDDILSGIANGSLAKSYFY